MVKRRIILTESKLRRIIAKEVENLLRESKEIKSVTYKGQTLSIHKFEMSDPNDNEFIKSHKDVIWDILQRGYENMGGFKGFQTQKDMLKKSPFYTLGLCDGEIITVTVYNTYLGGNKCVGASCVKDGNHAIAVKLLEMIMEYNITNWDEWVWLEASGKVEEMCKQLNGFNVPSKYVIIYLGNKSYSIVDDYHYIRKINGNEETKTIFGFKSQDAFNFLSNKINSQVNDFLKQLESKNVNENDERDRIWAEYSKSLSEMERVINIINYFIYLKDDELLNEFPIESINILKNAIERARQLMENNDYSESEQFRYNNCIDDGQRVLNTSSVLNIFKLTA